MYSSRQKKNHLIVVLGTRAQIIKMAPLLAELERRAFPYRLLLTGQHRETIAEILEEFGVQSLPQRLYNGPEVKGIRQAGPWIVRTAWSLWKMRKQWAPSPRADTVVVTHGDTFTTLIAAAVGWLSGTRVAHVEAGLRSFNWRHPFPEELTRRIVTRLSHIAYCPGEWACKNIYNQRLMVVNTGANTILDALRWAITQPMKSGTDSPTPYAVVSVHRFENLYSRQRMAVILETINDLACRMNVIVVLHPATRKRLAELNKLQELEANSNIDLRPRMTYVPFMQLISRSCLVITDGGSNQEELSYLGIPTLLMRAATERQEGMGENVILSEFRQDTIRNAISAASRSDNERGHRLPNHDPVNVIVDDLSTRFHIQAEA